MNLNANIQMNINSFTNSWEERNNLKSNDKKSILISTNYSQTKRKFNLNDDELDLEKQLLESNQNSLTLLLIQLISNQYHNLIPSLIMEISRLSEEDSIPMFQEGDIITCFEEKSFVKELDTSYGHRLLDFLKAGETNFPAAKQSKPQTHNTHQDQEEIYKIHSSKQQKEHDKIDRPPLSYRPEINGKKNQQNQQGMKRTSSCESEAAWKSFGRNNANEAVQQEKLFQDKYGQNKEVIEQHKELNKENMNPNLMSSKENAFLKDTHSILRDNLKKNIALLKETTKQEQSQERQSDYQIQDKRDVQWIVEQIKKIRGEIQDVNQAISSKRTQLIQSDDQTDRRLAKNIETAGQYLQKEFTDLQSNFQLLKSDLLNNKQSNQFVQQTPNIKTSSNSHHLKPESNQIVTARVSSQTSQQVDSNKQQSNYSIEGTKQKKQPNSARDYIDVSSYKEKQTNDLSNTSNQLKNNISKTSKQQNNNKEPTPRTLTQANSGGGPLSQRLLLENYSINTSCMKSSEKKQMSVCCNSNNRTINSSNDKIMINNSIDKTMATSSKGNDSNSNHHYNNKQYSHNHHKSNIEGNISNAYASKFDEIPSFLQKNKNISNINQLQQPQQHQSSQQMIDMSSNYYSSKSSNDMSYNKGFIDQSQSQQANTNHSKLSNDSSKQLRDNNNINNNIKQQGVNINSSSARSLSSSSSQGVADNLISQLATQKNTDKLNKFMIAQSSRESMRGMNSMGPVNSQYPLEVNASQIIVQKQKDQGVKQDKGKRDSGRICSFQEKYALIKQQLALKIQ